MKLLADRDLQLDTIGDPTMYGEVIRLNDRLPRLRIVMDHLPLDPIKDTAIRKQAEAALRELGHRPSVYAKVSGVLRPAEEHVPVELSYYKESLDSIWETFGRDRVIYASNWPVSNRFAPYPQILKIVREYFTGKGPEAAERYFWKNSLAAYKWVDRT
jgi:L-fuconolactonase